MTTGIDHTNGQSLGDLAHLKQSITDILTTRIGTRIMRYEYGSELPALIDTPAHPDRYIEFYAATAAALNKWEHRFQLQRVSVAGQSFDPLALVLDLIGLYLPSGELITIEGITIQ